MTRRPDENSTRERLRLALDRSPYQPFDGSSSMATPPWPGPSEQDDVSFSGTQVARIVGITYRQLDYWARTDLIKPSIEESKGGGSRRRYSYRDLLELRVIKTLLDAGIRLESVRDVFNYLRQHVTTDIASANIVIQGTSVVLCENDELIKLLQSVEGVLNVLPLASVKDSIDSQLARLAEAEAESGASAGADDAVAAS